MHISPKEFLKKALCSFINVSRRTKIGQFIYSYIVNTAMIQMVVVSHDGMAIKFCTPNSLCMWRAKTFVTKEPETIEWIESIPTGSVLWDIGANVGLYTIYAAMHRNCSVFAFEPSVFNLELLARNVFLNDQVDRVVIIPLALSDNLGVNKLRMTSSEWGGACSTFGQRFGWDGQLIKKVFEFQTIGLTMIDAIECLGIPSPDYVKMDVDGIEHLILKGGIHLLENVKGILIEINDDFYEQHDMCQKMLTNSGLVLKEKRQAEIFENTVYKNSFNQIWGRP